MCVSLALGLAVACIPSAHRLEPYRDDPRLAKQLESRAEAVCRERRSAPPHTAFKTDGCSMSPDGDWLSCCLEHDIEYWCGGPPEARRRADSDLRVCVERDHGGFQAGAMYYGVRAGGPAWMPLPWRWGYGWPWLSDDATSKP